MWPNEGVIITMALQRGVAREGRREERKLEGEATGRGASQGLAYRNEGLLQREEGKSAVCERVVRYYRSGLLWYWRGWNGSGNNGFV